MILNTDDHVRASSGVIAHYFSMFLGSIFSRWEEYALCPLVRASPATLVDFKDCCSVSHDLQAHIPRGYKTAAVYLESHFMVLARRSESVSLGEIVCATLCCSKAPGFWLGG